MKGRLALISLLAASLALSFALRDGRRVAAQPLDAAQLDYIVGAACGEKCENFCCASGCEGSMCEEGDEGQYCGVHEATGPPTWDCITASAEYDCVLDGAEVECTAKLCHCTAPNECAPDSAETAIQGRAECTD